MTWERDGADIRALSSTGSVRAVLAKGWEARGVVDFLPLLLVERCALLVADCAELALWLSAEPCLFPLRIVVGLMIGSGSRG